MHQSVISKTRSAAVRTGITGIIAAVIASIAASAAWAPAAFAQAPQPANGYVQSLGGTVKSGFGLCWRTGYWTPELATEECDPGLVPKKGAPVRGAAVQTPAAAPKAVVEKITLHGDTLFDFDKSVIKPEGKQVLDRLVDQARELNLEVIVAVGHTDWVGTDEYNQKLSERRAESVKAYLVSKGIVAARVYTEGKGEKAPVADNKTDEGRAKNRRVEIEVIGTRTIK